MSNELKIKNLFSGMKLETRKINLFEPNIQEYCNRYFKIKNSEEKTIKIFPYPNFFILDIVFESPLLFAVNFPDKICFANKYIFTFYKLEIYTNNDGIEKISDCLEFLKLEILELELMPQEGIFFYRNRIQLLLSDTRKVIPEIAIITRIRKKMEIFTTNKNYR